MSEIVITANGEYALPESDTRNAILPDHTSVQILENSASAVVEFGRFDENGTFAGFNNGIIAEDEIIYHGRGCLLAISVTDISGGSVTVGWY